MNTYFTGAARFLLSSLLLGIALSFVPSVATAATPTCWAIDDDTPTLYEFTMDTSNVQAPTPIGIPRVNDGEGLAWRPSTNELFMWDDTTTYVIDPSTGLDVRTFTADFGGGNFEVEGATFYVDPTTKVEELWLTVEDKDGTRRADRYLVRIDPDTGANISSVIFSGGFLDPSIDYGNDTGGLAVDPDTKQFWISDDSHDRGVYPLNEVTGVIGAGTLLSPVKDLDAEGLSFDDAGFFYSESDEADDTTRFLWQIDGTTGTFTKAAGPFPGSGDVEAIACNAGARTFEVATTGSITIIKDATPDDPQDFAFTATGAGTSNFSLDDDADATLNNTQTFTGLADGAYSFTETAVANWLLNGISCTGNTNSTITTNATGVDITLSGNESIVCTFYNNIHTCPAGQIKNTVSITANESETTYANNSDSACLEVTAACALTASAVVSTCTNGGNDSDASNDTFTFDITVGGTNTGASTTYSYTSNSANISGNGTYSATAETDGTFTIANTTSPFDLTITDSVDNTCSTSVTGLVAPTSCSNTPQVDLELTKVASSNSVVSGDTVTYTITINNNGPSDATGIEVSDQLPVGVSYVSDTTSQGSYNSGTGIWAVGALANTATAILTIDVTID